MPGRTRTAALRHPFRFLPVSFLWDKETPGAFSTPGVSFYSSPFMIKFQMQSDSHCESDSHRLATVLWGRVPLGHGPSI